MCGGQSESCTMNMLRLEHVIDDKTAPESRKVHSFGGESPSNRMLTQLVKTNLGHYREVVSEEDAENRETRSRTCRPKCKKCEAK